MGVDLRRGGANTTGWVQSGGVQRGVASDGGWLARLRGKGREGWSVEGHIWVCGEGPAVTGHGLPKGSSGRVVSTSAGSG